MKKTSTTITTKFQQRRKFLLILPLFVIPGLFAAFYALGGGKGDQQQPPAKGAGMGFNMELPPPIFDKKEDKMDKLAFYKRADEDSIRRRELLQQDPYHRRANMPASLMPSRPAADTQADALLRRLDLLKQKMDQPEAVKPAVTRKESRHREIREPIIPERELTLDQPGRAPDTGLKNTDPELDRLNEMLDKIARLQRGEGEEAGKSTTARSEKRDEGSTDVPVSASVPAMVASDQVLVNGATIALRLTAAAQINGVLFPRDQLAYGVVSISNDRMLIMVNSIRREQSIFSTALQVYDLDGLPGIHIPGDLGRETAKQSMDQSINSMGMVGLGASPAAQVTNAGVLAAKSLLSRKVRMVRVAVRVGYQVLLRGTKTPIKVQAVPHEERSADSVQVLPDPATFIPFLHRTVWQEKMGLTLQGVYLRDSLLWLSMLLENHSIIDYKPGYVRWWIRDRHQRRRTAIQELTLQPVSATSMQVLPGDSSQVLLAGFKPFVLPRDKELVLQLAEGNGVRELVMKVGEKELSKAKRYALQ